MQKPPSAFTKEYLIMEAIDYEEKSQFSGSKKEQLELVKSIVSFANTSGGKIILHNSTCDPRNLDSAKLDDLVNKYIAPQIQNITSQQLENSDWQINVSSSKDKPHIFITEAGCQDENGTYKSLFYNGQVYARHGSKTEPANDDIRMMIQETVGDWLTKIAGAIQNLSLQFSAQGDSLPIRLSDDSNALAMRISDPNIDYPYTATTLSKAIGKNRNWVPKIAQEQGLKDNRIYSCTIYGASGNVAVIKYSESALAKLRKLVNDNQNC